jgi:hypothetical protein
MKNFLILASLVFPITSFAGGTVYKCTANQDPEGVVLTIEGTTQVRVKAMGKTATFPILHSIDPVVSKFYDGKIVQKGLSQDDFKQFYGNFDGGEYPADIVVNVTRPNQSWYFVTEDEAPFTCNVQN